MGETIYSTPFSSQSSGNGVVIGIGSNRAAKATSQNTTFFRFWRSIIVGFQIIRKNLGLAKSLAPGGALGSA